MKRVVALILIFCMCMPLPASFAEVQNSEKDPDGNWKALIEIMLKATMKSDDMYVSDVFYNDCFCWFMLLYMNDMYSGTTPKFRNSSSFAEAVNNNECDRDDLVAFSFLHMVMDSIEEDEKNNRYLLTSLIAAAQSIGGYDDVDINDFIDFSNLYDISDFIK